jgi:hypothetical protein
MDAQVATSAALHACAGVLRGRRRMTREQGRALERIGHAADYLLDTYICFGPTSEMLRSKSPQIEAMHIEAIQILGHARNRILESLPIIEPIYRRIWNAIARTRIRISINRKPAAAVSSGNLQ